MAASVSPILRAVGRSFAARPSLNDARIVSSDASPSLPYVVRRLPCVMTPLETVHSDAGTFQSVAAAETSISRAEAPDLRRYSCDVRTPALPPVDIEPQMRLRRMCSLGEANSVVTLF